jgi:hypothetical protein
LTPKLELTLLCFTTTVDVHRLRSRSLRCQHGVIHSVEKKEHRAMKRCILTIVKHSESIGGLVQMLFIVCESSPVKNEN